MKIKTVNNYYTDENTYIVYDENTKNGLVIDPGYKCDGILKAAQDDGVYIKYVLITHCHYDHFSDMEQLREKTGAKLVSGDKASINITDPDINLSYSGLGYELSAKKSDIVLIDNEELRHNMGNAGYLRYKKYFTLSVFEHKMTDILNRYAIQS